MPSSDKHLVVGCIFGALAYFGYKYLNDEKTSIGELFQAALIGGVFALAPDIIEPATSPNHRSFAHSILTLAAGSYETGKGLNEWDIDKEKKAILLAAFAGYASHIFLDGGTPKSVPLIA